MSMAWTKNSRIRKSRDFQIVQRNGHKWKSTDFLFIFLPSNHRKTSPSAQSRVGLVVSKKVGNAVARNLVKRRLREACRKNIESLEICVDVVVIAFSSAKDLTQIKVDSQVNHAFQRIQSRLQGRIKV